MTTTTEYNPFKGYNPEEYNDVFIEVPKAARTWEAPTSRFKAQPQLPAPRARKANVVVLDSTTKMIQDTARIFFTIRLSSD